MMQNSSQLERTVEVDKEVTTVCCRGVDDALGHPAVYLTFSDQNTVRCYYCGCEFRRAVGKINGSQDT